MIDEPISTRADSAPLTDDSRDYGKELRDARKRIAQKELQKKFVKQMGGASETQRWRLSVDFLLKTNDNALIEHRQALKEIKEVRADLKDKFASTQYMRHGLRLPGLVMDTLLLTDPNIESVWSSGSKEEKKRMLHKIMRTFPEYRIAQVI